MAVVVAAVALLPGHVVAQSARPTTTASLSSAFADIDRAFEQFAAREHVPGAAWGIVVNGQLVHTGTVGLRDVAAKSPVTADTVFRIASMTKSFTAMAILKLRDEGKLSLDDPAERYVPELKGAQISDDGFTTGDDPAFVVACGGLPRR